MRDRRPSALHTATLGLLLLLAGGVTVSSIPASVAREDPGAYKAIRKSPQWGRLVGTCRIAKAVPVPDIEVRVNGGTEKRPTPRIAYDEKTLGLSNCVVWLEGVKEGKPWPNGRHAVLAHVDRAYVPHVHWIPVNTQLALVNMDDETDNVHGFLGRQGRETTVFNLFVGPKCVIGDAANTYLERPGHHLILSDCCPSKSAHVFVVTHPYYSEPTGMRGTYAIEDIPPGTYTVVCWHEGMQHKARRSKDGRLLRYDFGEPIRIEKTITLEKQQTTTLDFTIPAP
ncbi:MAG: carboxypeptidase-like regulatory domain-containing protein [Planctomycetota bacterium]|nr:carboxypeptidase-like regulatory domain-containing protein [Planctomycetota bacterium]